MDFLALGLCCLAAVCEDARNAAAIAVSLLTKKTLGYIIAFGFAYATKSFTQKNNRKITA
ncbi:hypothetical protein CEN50_04215 [Fischerella thermalis CCMEE 5268]|uniref:Uncharacterized protein n=1 Tax=Fischerella thermalis CCMEE 5268 TaxID=2019662 RepID=A0A2N6KKF7_9CYAN|nr:hypothetical protein CEN50_04215 [Fischerella thermalis CCMEE 5268]